MKISNNQSIVVSTKTEVKKNWVKPELTVLSIKGDTLGGANPGLDGGSRS